MKEKKKKVWCLLLSGCLAVSVLAGCSSGSSDAGTVSSTVTESKKSDLETVAADPVENTTEGGFVHDSVLNDLGVEPICKETVVITIGIPANTNIEDYDTNYMTRLLEEKANVDIQFVTYTSTDAKEKVRVQIAGGDKLPDILIMNLDDAEVMGWGADGFFLPLEDYFANSSYYAAEAFASYKEKGIDVLDLCTMSDGHIWEFPKMDDSLTNPTGAKLWIYKPWLDSVGMTEDDIRDVDGFYDMLVAFKTKDPNGNGKADEIPMVGYALDTTDSFPECHPWVYVMNAFQQTTPTEDFLVSTDGKLSVSYTTDQFKEGVKFINKLVKEGLYDPISFTQDKESFKSLLNSADVQLVGCFDYTSTSYISADHFSKADWILADPLIGPNGYCSTSYEPDMPEGAAVISAECEHPEVAFRLLDLMCSEYLSIVNRHGEEGVNWMYAEDAKEKYPDADWSAAYGDYPPYILDYNSIWNAPGNGHWMNAGPHVRTAEISGGYFAATIATGLGQPYVEELAKHHNNYMAVIPKEPITKIKYASEEDQVKATDIYTELREYLYEKLGAWFTGASDVEADWDDYLATLEEIGLSEYLEIMQKGWK